MSKQLLTKIINLLEQDEGYPTPKVDVRTYIKKGDKILLVEDRPTKTCSLPAGYAKVGLTPKENIIKEVIEKKEITVSVDILLAVTR